MKEKSKEPKIFLYEKDIILWEKPLKPGYFKSGINYNAQTNLLESLGMDTLNKSLLGYSVQATAAKYLARVIRLGKNIYRNPSSKVEGTPKDLILFGGNIVIYLSGKIPGTTLEGFDLESIGDIWIAKTPTDILRSNDGLYNLIFGDETTEEGKVKRIKAILNGHEQIKRDRESARFKREHESWRSGKNQERERVFGTFGRG